MGRPVYNRDREFVKLLTDLNLYETPGSVYQLIISKQRDYWNDPKFLKFRNPTRMYKYLREHMHEYLGLQPDNPLLDKIWKELKNQSL